MQVIKQGDRGIAVAEVRNTLVSLGLLSGDPHDTTHDRAEDAFFDTTCELALREFQQARGLVVDGLVGAETWRSLVAARWRLGDRVLNLSVNEPLVGDDVHTLQERMLEMGYDVGRTDGVFGKRTAQALQAFQRECGIVADGVFGPLSMRALRRLGRKVVGGRPQLLRESASIDHAGPALAGKRVVIDPGHGATDSGVTVALTGTGERITEAQLCHDLALRLEGRFAAVGVQSHLTHGAESNPTTLERADFANNLGADVLISLHMDGHRNQDAHGVATYHFGAQSGVTSTIGERLAGLVQREIVVRTGLHNCRTHAKTWEILRLTRMPAVQIELGYLTSPKDRARLADPVFRDTVADAILIAVQRIFLPIDADVATGTLDVRHLRALQLS